MVTKGVYLKFPATTSHEWFLRDHWDLGTHRGRKECLSEASRPGLISTVSPDLAQPTHGLEEEDALGVILFQRLKVNHLRPKYGVLRVVYYESLKRELKTKPKYEFRCDERLQTKVEESTRLSYTLFIMNR